MKDTLHEAIQLAKYAYERDHGDWPEDEHFGSVLTCKTLAAEVLRLEQDIKWSKAQLSEMMSIVESQAKGEGLWFDAQYITEARLQNELRILHAAVENAYGF